MQNSDFTPSEYDFNVFSVKINSLKLTKAWILYWAAILTTILYVYKRFMINFFV
jgi:hypothetical protein